MLFYPRLVPINDTYTLDEGVIGSRMGAFPDCGPLAEDCINSYRNTYTSLEKNQVPRELALITISLACLVAY